MEVVPLKTMPAPPSASDLQEFESSLRTIDTLSMKMKRKLYSAMRGGATEHALIPRIGMTLGQVGTYLVLRDKA